MNILYVSKLNKSMANGVTVAVLQLINSLCEHACVYWLDLNDNKFDVNPKVKVAKKSNEIPSNIDLAVFEDPFNTLKFCKIAKTMRKRKIPYVLVPHGCFNKKALNRKRAKKIIAIKTVLRSFFNGCAGVQYLTENEQNNSMSFNRKFIIPNGIKQTEYCNKAEKIKKLIYIGRKDIDHKGLDLLIEGASIVQEELRREQCSIQIYGPTNLTDDENRINELIEKYGLQDIIYNNGPLFGDEKEKALCRADAFIQTSRYEGFPMSLLEAFTYGLPVLITEGTNLTEMVNENGAGFTCKTNPQDISNMIKEAINCSNVVEKSKNAKKLGEKYSWDSICKQTIEEYSRLIKGVNNER